MCGTGKETQMYRPDIWTLWERARVGWSERIALKHVYYLWWNRSPAQVGCMRQVLRAGALGRPRGMGWGGRWEGGSGCKSMADSCQCMAKPLQYCKVISLQLIKINKKRKEMQEILYIDFVFCHWICLIVLTVFFFNGVFRVFYKWNLVICNTETVLLHPFLLGYLFFFFSCMIFLDKTSISMLSKSTLKYPCFVSDLGGKTLSYSPLNMMLALDL